MHRHGDRLAPAPRLGEYGVIAVVPQQLLPVALARRPWLMLLLLLLYNSSNSNTELAGAWGMNHQMMETSLQVDLRHKQHGGGPWLALEHDWDLDLGPAFKCSTKSISFEASASYASTLGCRTCCTCCGCQGWCRYRRCSSTRPALANWHQDPSL